MPARRLPAFLLLLSITAIGLLAGGCFQAHKAGQQVTGEITIGAGTNAEDVTVGGSGSETTTEDTATEATGATTDGSSSGAPANADVAAGKTAFTKSCGTCHTLKDAGSKAQVGPSLDELAPLAYDRVASQIKNGGGAMPPGLASGQDLINIAAYVSSVAGK